MAGRKAAAQEDQISGWASAEHRATAHAVHKAAEVKTAFATWHDRIAPLFESSRHAHIVDCSPGRVPVERRERFVDASPVRKVLCLVQWRVDTLVCGAISLPVQSIVRAHAIRLIPFVASDLGAAVQAFLDGCITEPRFAMPGYGERELSAESSIRLDLDLSRHCIETEIKRLHNRAISDFFRASKPSDKEAVERVVALTQLALASFDFPALRSMYPSLAGRTRARVVLEQMQDCLVIRIDGRRIAPEVACGAGR